MKKDLHPAYVDTTVTCTCGATSRTRSTATSGKIAADVCSACHPFYTGKQNSWTPVAASPEFQERYGKKVAK